MVRYVPKCSKMLKIEISKKMIMFGHVQKVFLGSFRLFRTNFEKKLKSPHIRDAGIAIESSGCAYVYISDDMGWWWGVGGFGEGWWDVGCGVSGWWWVYTNIILILY